MPFVVFFQGILWPFSCYFSPGYTEGELGRPLVLEAVVVRLRCPALQACWGGGISSAVSVDYGDRCAGLSWVVS